jgi:hypothetical protein
MPDLIHSLQNQDLGHLRIIAGLWRIEFNPPDVQKARQTLAQAMLDADLISDVVSELPAEALTALQALVKSDGEMLWAVFSRNFGSVREMGSGRRDREKPYLKPVSPAEVLFYRGLFSRAFLKRPADNPAQEYVYIPDDLFHLLPIQATGQEAIPGRPASPTECAQVIPASDRILDHACTLLAALRMGMPVETLAFPLPGLPGGGISPAALVELLGAGGLIGAQDTPNPELVRIFLEQERKDALVSLVQKWQGSAAFNELRLMPGIVCEGEWVNDSLKTRQVLLEILREVPVGVWWNLASLVRAVRERQPDYQRPAGDYDSWYIRRAGSEEYLRGYDHWDAVDGALVRFLVTGPLHWLGILDLAAPAPEAATEEAPSVEGQAQPVAVEAFRYSAWGAAWLDGKPPDGLAKEEAVLQLLPDGRLKVPALVPRAVRYQVARFCEWDEDHMAQSDQVVRLGEYRYRVTPASLERARRQGLRLGHLLGLLRKHSAAPLNIALVQALEHWDADGVQASMEQVLVLRVANPDILTALRRSKAARYLGDPLGPTAVLVNSGAAAKVSAALIELGYLTEMKFDD